MTCYPTMFSAMESIAAQIVYRFYYEKHGATLFAFSVFLRRQCTTVLIHWCILLHRSIEHCVVPLENGRIVWGNSAVTVGS